MLLDLTPRSPLPLPEGWSLSERVDDVVQVEGLTIRRAGLCATSDSGQAVGSAAETDGDPTPRATYELLERIALLDAARATDSPFPLRLRSGEEVGTIRCKEVFPSSDAPAVWEFARSSGVSLHADWALACDAALRELIERDRLLRAWVGETVPVRFEGPAASSMLAAATSYDWRTYLFPAPAVTTMGGDVQVAGIFGFPKVACLSLVLGFGARSSAEDAVLSAQREALQSLAFLWGEPIPERVPDPVPTPLTHLETFQVRDRHALLLHWLEQGHAAHYRPRPVAMGDGVRFADITPSWLHGRLHVVRALSPAAIPLTLGLSPILAHLPPELRIHPIP